MDYLLIWVKSGILYANVIDQPPDILLYEGQMFYPISNFLGDVDYIRNKSGKLVGFAYTIGTEHLENHLSDQLMKNTNQIHMDEGTLMIQFTAEIFDVQCVQAIGTQIYRGPSNAFILAVPDWGFNEFAFPLSSVPAPSMIKSESN